MKSLKQISSLIIILVILVSFSQCSTAQKLQEKPPIGLGETYAQKWVAGVKGGGSGINVFIPVKDTSVTLDSIYFRGQKEQLEFVKREQALYVGRFRTDLNQSKDLILSSDMKEESKNRLPKLKEKLPFEFNDDECIITYRKGGKTMYYKISNIKMEEPLNYPSAPPNRQ
jgi:hypothetical protein